MVRVKVGDGILFGFLILGSIGCTDRFFPCPCDKAPTSKNITKKEATPKPVGWPPENQGSAAFRDSQPKQLGGIQGTTASRTGDTIPIQQVGLPEKTQNDTGVIQAQRLETVPYSKAPVSQPSLMPGANLDPQKLPIIPESPSTPSGREASNSILPTNNSLVVPPPPPGSPLSGAAPLGIPSPPSSAPNR